MAGFGDTLQQARAHKGVTLKEAEQSTRINRQHLSALENEKFEALPPLIYQRGIVRNYAVYLDLDPARMLALFEEAHGAFAPPPARGVRGMESVAPIDMPSHWTPNFAIIAFAVVLGAIVFAWGYSAYVASPGDTGTPTIAIPTMTPFSGDIALPTDPPVTAAPTTQPTATNTPVQINDSATVPGRGDNQRSQDEASDQPAPTATATEPAQTIEEPTVEATEPPASDDLATRNEERQQAAASSDALLGGITITAQGSDLTLTVTVDGTVEFDGVLPAGQTTDEFIGSNFEVSTSSGNGTVFTDHCGNTFNIGYEVGPANYSFSADGSCPPS